MKNIMAVILGRPVIYSGFLDVWGTMLAFLLGPAQQLPSNILCLRPPGTSQEPGL